MRSGAISVLLIACAIGCQQHFEHTTNLSDVPSPDRGKDAIAHYGCASCHTIPGIRNANGLVGPSLDRIASRTYIAGVLQNTHANMLRWIKDPPKIDDKTAMPNLRVSDPDARDIAAFLYTLR
jgi:cytochrome c